MFGQMQDVPLLVNNILDHANDYHGDREIVSRLVEGNIHRQTYADAHLRARKLSQALIALGAAKGDVVATLAWNTHRHLEAWYGITGTGGIYHTLNPRLFPEQLVYIINHANDKIIMTDLTFVPILEAIEAQIPNVEHIIIMTDAAHMPDTSLKNARCYEDLLDGQSGDFDWVAVDERDPCGMCYTSGTTGNPKGVCYTHRSNVLHTLVANSADVMGISSTDNVMPVVPMFHANAWGMAFSAPAAGAKIVNPGPNMDGESIYHLLTDEKVSFTAAVPTVWLMLLQHMEANDLKLPDLNSVAIGGSAVPRVMLEKFERDYEVSVMHAWGMTELSPLGTIASFKAGMEKMSFDEQMDIKVKQGRPPYLVQMKITDDEGNELPRDGKAFGHLKVRGPFIVGEYIKGDGGEILDENGYFDTGDVATIDPLGFMQITDRSKDVIKSGGEWISSIEVENVAVGCDGVTEAAVIGLPHPKWDERPLLIIVKDEGADISKDEVLAYLDGKIAKWWMPDDVVFVDEIPHTATGKIQKLTLREQFSDYTLPTAGTGGGMTMLGISVATLSLWALRLGVAAPVLALVLIGLFRLGVMDFRLPLLGVAVATLLAGIALLLAAGALIGGVGGDGAHAQKAAIALVVSLLVLFAPLNTVRKGGGVPRIHDISTDLENPPLFETVPGLRAAGDNSLDLNPKVQAAQKAFYTDLAPLLLPGAPDGNFAAAEAAAKAMGWDIVAADAADGRLEATATTPLFGFKDDVVIRLTASAADTRVDMRSASRVGLSDLGANAARIKAYFEALKAAQASR